MQNDGIYCKRGMICLGKDSETLKMNKCILVRSVTYAQKAQKLLNRNNIKSTVSKQIRASRYGCAWCVIVDERLEKRSLEILSNGGVLMTGDVYYV